MWITRVGKAILSDYMLGYIEYYRFPQLAASWGGPFNGQVARQAIVLELLRTLPVDIVVETGTYRGTTTEFLSSHLKIPILTVEHDGRFYGYVRARFRKHGNITITKSDSRAFLHKLVHSNRLAGKNPFFYLDAHWGPDLPLFDELELIFTHWPKAVVAIDDFEVTDDPDYAFDDYGEGKALTSKYIAPLVERFGLAKFFPSTMAKEETGLRRGCIILVKNPETVRLIDSMSCLRRGDFPVDELPGEAPRS